MQSDTAKLATTAVAAVVVGAVAVVGVLKCTDLSTPTKKLSSEKSPSQNAKLGAFSISLAVKDLQVSKAFYEKLGFSTFGGDEGHNYLIMKNGEHIIGICQGMFEKNILTINPGWDQSANVLESYTDIRELQKELKAKGIEMTLEVDELKTKGPASFALVDPDGNEILMDQHM